MYYRVRNSNYQRSGTYISKPKFAEPDAAGVDVKCKGWLMNNSHNTNPLLKSIQEQYSIVYADHLRSFFPMENQPSNASLPKDQYPKVNPALFS